MGARLCHTQTFFLWNKGILSATNNPFTVGFTSSLLFWGDLNPSLMASIVYLHIVPLYIPGMQHQTASSSENQKTGSMIATAGSGQVSTYI